MKKKKNVNTSYASWKDVILYIYIFSFQVKNIINQGS